MPVTRKQFEEVYRKYDLSKCEIFYIQHLSIFSLSRNIWSIIYGSIGLMIPFIFATIGHFLDWPLACTYIPSFIYAGLLALVGLFSLRMWHKKAARIRHICKDLNITKKQYESVIRKYYQHHYPDLKDQINDIIEQQK